MLIHEPTVFPIARTTLDAGALDSWVGHNRLDELDVEGTPLFHLLENARSGEHPEGELLAEFAGRHCYRSWQRGRPHGEYMDNLIESGHTSVLEHHVVSFAIQGVSRSASHEIVRHRAGMSPSQESLRFVVPKDVQFVVPPLVLLLAREAPHVLDEFELACMNSKAAWLEFYGGLQGAARAQASNVGRKVVAEAARALLPHATETRMVLTGNVRAWRHFLMLRASTAADMEIRRLAMALFPLLKAEAPAVFSDFRECVVPGVGDRCLELLT